MEGVPGKRALWLTGYPGSVITVLMLSNVKVQYCDNWRMAAILTSWSKKTTLLHHILWSDEFLSGYSHSCYRKCCNKTSNRTLGFVLFMHRMYKKKLLTWLIGLRLHRAIQHYMQLCTHIHIRGIPQIGSLVCMPPSENRRLKILIRSVWSLTTN